MSRITKTLAEQVALQLTEPKKNEIYDLHQKLKQKTTECYLNNIPYEVIEFFNKYPEYFQVKITTQFKGSGFNYEYYDINKSPKLSVMPSIGSQEGNKIISLKAKLDDLRSEYRKLIAEIEIALIGLRTYNNVEREFPEAFKLLPPITTTALTVDLKSIRCKIDKKNC